MNVPPAIIAARSLSAAPGLAREYLGERATRARGYAGERATQARAKLGDAGAAALGVGAIGAPLTAVAATRAYRRAKARGASTAQALRAAAVPAALGAALTGAAAYGAVNVGWAGPTMPAMPAALRFSNLSSSWLMLSGARPRQGGAPPDPSGPVAARDLRNAGPLDDGSLMGALPSKDGPAVSSFATAEEPPEAAPEPTGYTTSEYRELGLLEEEAKLASRLQRQKEAERRARPKAEGARGAVRRMQTTGQLSRDARAREQKKIGKEAQARMQVAAAARPGI